MTNPFDSAGSKAPPKPFTVEFITSYGYEDKVALLVPVTAPATARPAQVAV